MSKDHEKLRCNQEQFKGQFAHFCGEYKFEVDYHDTTYTVDLKDKTCGCRQWDLTGIPCKHACAAIGLNKQKVEDYVHHCYSRDTYLGVYHHMIQPIPGKHDWVKSNQEEIRPPFMRRPSGKPKKARRKAAEEVEDTGTGTLSRAERYMSCSKCLQKGHNLRSCKNPIHPNSKLLKIKDLPSASQHEQKGQPKQKKSRTTALKTSTQPSVDAGFYTKPAQSFAPINPGFYTQPNQGNANSANPGFSSRAMLRLRHSITTCIQHADVALDGMFIPVSSQPSKLQCIGGKFGGSGPRFSVGVANRGGGQTGGGQSGGGKACASRGGGRSGGPRGGGRSGAIRGGGRVGATRGGGRAGATRGGGRIGGPRGGGRSGAAKTGAAQSKGGEAGGREGVCKSLMEEYPTYLLLFLFNVKATTAMLLLRLVVVANVVSLLSIPQFITRDRHFLDYITLDKKAHYIHAHST
ncbi:uncharacterized protein LOC131299645 [Rhododendron vialii]|uniref:uncharacterized protein LOC131299645 n=1 Tax=Rhododendron vialii TaxID=182163 RepID=UPI00265F8180|nr:uncharacterized protein LOC131299645 [Rhododendron vialii]